MNELRYVYAVAFPFTEALPEEIRGVAGSTPRLLHHGGLVAAVSAVSSDEFGEAPLRTRLEDLEWLTETARGHQAVVAALTSITCPLPLRLATVCLEDNGVRRLLDSGRDRFVRTLARLDGRVEWGVKVYAATEPPGERSPALISPQDRAGPGPTGREYLRRRLRERRSREDVWELADTVSRRLHEELSRRAEAGVLHRPQQAQLSKTPGHNVFNAAYLVPREESTAFVERVDQLRSDQPGVRVELTGPWAPYSFADGASDR